MKSIFNDSRSAIQFVATLAIALSGAVLMTQEATPFNEPQCKAPPVNRSVDQIDSSKTYPARRWRAR